MTKKSLLFLALLGAPLAVLAPLSPLARAQNEAPVFAFNTDQAGAFRTKVKGFAKVDGDDLPYPWSANAWNGQTLIELALSDAPVEGRRALRLSNLEGAPALQFYPWQKTKIGAGNYELRFSYLSRGGGNVSLEGQNVAKKTTELTAKTQWTDVAVPFVASGEGDFAPNFQASGSGLEASIYLANIRVVPVAASPEKREEPKPENPKPENPKPQSVAGPNKTANLAALSPDAAPSAYGKALLKETADLKPRLFLLPSDPDEATAQFHFVNFEGAATGQLVDVDGPGFKKAYRIQTSRKDQEWKTHIQLKNTPAISAGDVIYVTAWMRAVQVVDSKAEGEGRLYASESRPNQSDNHLMWTGDFKIPAQWKRFHFPMTASRNHGEGDGLHLMWTFGHTAQTVEIGGIAALNFGPGVDLSLLPHDELKLTYEGIEENAPWRKAALERIEKIRKSDLKIQVVDANDQPVKEAQVAVEMKRHAFWWGSSVAIGLFPGQNVKPWHYFSRTAGASQPDKERFQKEVKRLFNTAYYAPFWATWTGSDPRISQADILAQMQWFKENDLRIAGGQVIYPGVEFADARLQNKLTEADRAIGRGEKPDPAVAKEFETALKNWVVEYTRLFRPYGLAEFQIANEFEGRPAYTRILGGDPYDRVAQWFEWAEAADPQILRATNHSSGTDFYFNMIRELQKRKAPIQAVGMQYHSALSSPSPLERLAEVDKFWKAFGLPIGITEYELTLQNANDPKQREFQRQYTRDMLIAMFAHPGVYSFILQDFWQPAAWQADGGSAFFDKDWKLQPHGQAYEDLVLKRWWTRAQLKSNAQGLVNTRGFQGDYQITVTAGGRTKTLETQLGATPQTVRVQF